MYFVTFKYGKEACILLRVDVHTYVKMIERKERSVLRGLYEFYASRRWLESVSWFRLGLARGRTQSQKV